MKRAIIFILLCTMAPGLQSQDQNIQSNLEVYDLETGQHQIVYSENAHFEAPNWSPDDTFFLINQSGKIFRIDRETLIKEPIFTGFANQSNNDHGISPDGRLLAISHMGPPGVPSEQGDWRSSRIYTLPVSGGTPDLVTRNAPSFWHSWSPDGQTLLYTGMRRDDFDIYAISVGGGTETRLTRTPGLDDGPDFSHDGTFIFYNSIRSGRMEIWKMDCDGKEHHQITDDAFSNWFPHPSPDGRHVVFLSYLEDQGDRHPPMKEVALRLLDLRDHGIKTLCTFTGGQGTINVPSWSPDGRKFIFVSYEYIEATK
jgi:Tol biopolymer transport system component